MPEQRTPLELVTRAAPWLGVIVFIGLLAAYLGVSPYAGTRSMPTLPPLEGVALTEESERWTSIEYDGRRLGWAQTRRAPAEDGLRIDDLVFLRMTLMGQQRDVTTRQTLFTDEAGHLRTFTFSLESEGASLNVEGKQEAGELRLKVHSAGSTQDLSFKAPEPIILSGNLHAEMARAGLEVGKRFTRTYFDPSVMKPATMRLHVEGVEEWKIGPDSVNVYRVVQHYNGLESTAWVDDEGTLYKEESQTGFSSKRTTREDAQDLSDGAGFDLIAATSIKVENPIPNPRQVRRLVVELKGVELEGFELHGDGQSLDGNTLTIDWRDVDAEEIEASAYLGDEALMQVSHPDIQQAARKAAGDSDDPAEVSRTLLTWVYRSLAKTTTVSIPSALEVLQTKAGDCNEHAILYTALTRARGIPSRIASGVVALENSFYYHAWTELYLDGRWVSVDPVFGQYPADATHIRFVTGGLDRQAELMRVIGQLEIKVLESET